MCRLVRETRSESPCSEQRPMYHNVQLHSNKCERQKKIDIMNILSSVSQSAFDTANKIPYQSLTCGQVCIIETIKQTKRGFFLRPRAMIKSALQSKTRAAGLRSIIVFSLNFCEEFEIWDTRALFSCCHGEDSSQAPLMVDFYTSGMTGSTQQSAVLEPWPRDVHDYTKRGCQII